MDELRNKLRKDFPKEAMQEYKKSDNSNAPTFTMIKQMYVVERLNDCFGIFGWSFDYILHENEKFQFADVSLTVYNIEADALKTGAAHKTVKYTGGAMKFMGTDAPKSAITDGLSKCASVLEIGIEVFKGHVNLNKPSDIEANNSMIKWAIDKKVDTKSIEAFFQKKMTDFVQQDRDSFRDIWEKFVCK